MNTWDVLKAFREVNESCDRAGQYILRQNPMRYEEEYGKSLVQFTDENLMDLFVYKLKFYKMFSLGNVMSRYHAFYRYCVEQGLRRQNPFTKSMYLSYGYLVREIVEAGNVPYYTEDCLEKIWNGQGDNAPYFKAVLLSLYEGVKNYKELSLLRYTDVDFERKELKLGDRMIPLSDRLSEAYEELHNMEYYTFGVNTRAGFYDEEGLLIRRIAANREVKSSSGLANKNNIVSKLSKLYVAAAGVYDSGLMNRLSKAVGKELLLEYLIGEDIPKGLRIDYNKALKEIFETEKIRMSVKNFIYDYRVYGYCMKYNLVRG